MKLKLFLVALLSLPVFLFAQTNSSQEIINKKIKYDLLRNADQLKIQVLARMGNDTIYYVINDAEFPASGINITINILRDNNGKIFIISVYPYSESGDWFVGFTHYFDEKGNTFAFERITSFYNSGCTDEMATEKIDKFYSSDFIELGNTYSLNGPDNKPLKKSKCDLLYQFNYSVYRNIKEVLAKNHIPTSVDSN